MDTDLPIPSAPEPPSKIRVKLTMSPARGQFSDYVGSFVDKLLHRQRVMVAVERSEPVSALMDEVAMANEDKILRGLNAALAEAQDNIVASVSAFTLLNLSVGGYDLTDNQMLSDIFPMDDEVTVHATFRLDLRFKSKFSVSLSFTPSEELFGNTLKVSPQASASLTLASDNAHRIAVRDLVERLVAALPANDGYRAAMARSKLKAITWEGERYTVDDSVYLVSGLLQPLPPRSNWDAHGAGIAVKASVEVDWCKVGIPACPFQKLGSGCLPTWRDKQMAYTNGMLVWRSKSGKVKKERVTLAGAPSVVDSSKKEVTLVKAASGETRRLRGSSTHVDALVVALQNKLALTLAIQAPIN